MQDRISVEGVGRLPFLMLATSRDGNVFYANHALQALLSDAEQQQDDPDGSPVSSAVTTKLHASGLLDQLASLEAPLAHRSEFSGGDGQTVAVQWYSHPIRGMDGKATHVESMGVVVLAKPAPIPAYRETYDCTCGRLAHLLRILDEVSDHVSIVDVRGIIEYINPAFEAVSGRSKEWAIGRHIMEVWSEPLDPEFEKDLEAALRAGNVFRGERVNRNARGELFFDDVTIVPMRGLSGQVTHVIAACRDTTYRHLTDPLTGLQSRHLLVERIKASIERTRQTRDRSHLALLFVDIDRFKAINDTCGKSVGDQVILEVSRRIQHAIPETGASGRVTHINRDEFAVLLESVESDGDAASIAEGILRRIRKPLVLEGLELVISASVGIAMGPRDYEQPEDILRDAETAMDQAKRGGGNAHALFRPTLHAKIVGSVRLGSELRRALDQQELWLAYQPIVSLSTGEVTGAEALVRWQHPARGLVPPGDFIQAAEDNGLIVEIGEYVLRRACGQMRAWEDLGHGAVAVNVSARQLRHPEFLALVEEALKESGVPGNRLKLEVTESTAAHDPGAVTLLLERLKALGVEILMDDFGTGYSSLNYLTRFPLDKLKIDRSFVQRVPGSVHDASVATTIVAMAHSLELGVIAEGVETREQLQFLCALGCEEMQGYLFSRPLKADDFEALVRSGRRLELPEPELQARVSVELPAAAATNISGVHAKAGRAREA